MVLINNYKHIHQTAYTLFCGHGITLSASWKVFNSLLNVKSPETYFYFEECCNTWKAFNNMLGPALHLLQYILRSHKSLLDLAICDAKLSPNIVYMLR